MFVTANHNKDYSVVKSLERRKSLFLFPQLSQSSPLLCLSFLIIILKMNVQ